MSSPDVNNRGTQARRAATRNWLVSVGATLGIGFGAAAWFGGVALVAFMAGGVGLAISIALCVLSAIGDRGKNTPLGPTARRRLLNATWVASILWLATFIIGSQEADSTLWIVVGAVPAIAVGVFASTQLVTRLHQSPGAGSKDC
jgi:hypothetical protein